MKFIRSFPGWMIMTLGLGGILLSLLSNKLSALALVGAALAAIALILQNVLAKRYEILIKMDQWREEEERYTFRIEAKVHGQGKHPSVRTYEPGTDMQNEVITDVSVGKDGDVEVGVSRPQPLAVHIGN